VFAARCHKEMLDLKAYHAAHPSRASGWRVGASGWRVGLNDSCEDKSKTQNSELRTQNNYIECYGTVMNLIRNLSLKRNRS
ncbi:MAG: hypothetical protein NT018_02400, partial [Armatimonadetes bacterium]|nr:hypothetical protein [Armatimonadota bacterium]